MSTGYFFLLGSLVGFGGLGIFHKVADHPNCRPRLIALSLLFWACVLTFTYTWLFEPKGLRFPPRVLVIGAAGGLFASSALFVFQTGLKYGKISTSWLVLNLSMSLPVMISLCFFNEKINWIKGAGIAFVLCAIVMLWRDKKIDLDKTHRDEGAQSSGHHTKWLLLMLLAFVFNGLSASTSKVLVGAGQGDYTWQFYVILYGAGFMVIGAASCIQKSLPNFREFSTGFIMAVCSVAGNVLLTLALSHGVEGAVAFPSANGGSLTLVVLAGVLFFKEHIHPIGRLGITCGICAILLLVMEPTLLIYFQNHR
jgi:drug/metabolite transporter (DMT)-like permease